MGVPVIAPVDVFSDSPVGKAPDCTDHVIVGPPVVSVKTWENATDSDIAFNAVSTLTGVDSMTLPVNAWSPVP